MKTEDAELDAIPGLPAEALPEGERILWQGRPQWRALVRHAFKIRWIAAYLAVFLVARMVSVATGGAGADGALQVVVMAVLFAGCLGLCALLAWSQARSAIYTITTHRVVMQVGAACPVTWNLPFRRIEAADLTVRDEGDGDVVLRLVSPDRVAWVHLWPHARPGHRLKACPTLRAIAQPRQVAALLGEAVRDWAAEQPTTPGVFVDAAVGDHTKPPLGSVEPLPVGPRLASEAHH
ncbi:MAG: photosynthetic complex putative assembly protein PuhB [Myxococcota bacterium]